MKKLTFGNSATTKQQSGKSSNWKFGWSVAAADPAILDKRTFTTRGETHGSGAYGMLVSKASSIL